MRLILAFPYILLYLWSPTCLGKKATLLLLLLYVYSLSLYILYLWHHIKLQAAKKIADAKLTTDFQTILKEFQKAQRLAVETEAAYAPFFFSSRSATEVICCTYFSALLPYYRLFSPSSRWIECHVVTLIRYSFLAFLVVLTVECLETISRLC